MKKKRVSPGNRFGKLTAIEATNGGKWRCTCDCGKQTEALGYNLLSGNTRSCGCLMGRPKVQKEESPNQLIYQFVSPADTASAFRKYCAQRNVTIQDMILDLILREVKRLKDKVALPIETPLADSSGSNSIIKITRIPKAEWLQFRAICNRQRISAKDKIIDLMIRASSPGR